MGPQRKLPHLSSLGIWLEGHAKAPPLGLTAPLLSRVWSSQAVLEVVERQQTHAFVVQGLSTRVACAILDLYFTRLASH